METHKSRRVVSSRINADRPRVFVRLVGIEVDPTLAPGALAAVLVFQEHAVAGFPGGRGKFWTR